MVRSLLLSFARRSPFPPHLASLNPAPILTSQPRAFECWRSSVDSSGAGVGAGTSSVWRPSATPSSSRTGYDAAAPLNPPTQWTPLSFSVLFISTQGITGSSRRLTR